MASSDARPFPLKNTAFRVVFPIFDKTGALVTGAAGLDSEISKDQGTFADCTNEATEIATSSGVYYLDLTSTEMNADHVAVIVKTSTTDARTTVLSLYPAEDGDIRVNVVQFGGSAGSFSSGRPSVNVNSIATDAVNAAALASDAVTELQSGLATASALSTVAGYIDTEVAAIKAVTDGLNAQLTTIDSNVDAILVDTGTDIPAAFDALPTAADVATAVMGSTIEGSYDLTEMTRLFAAALLGKSSGHGTGTVIYRDTGDTKDRIEATVDAGDRDSVTLDAS